MLLETLAIAGKGSDMNNAIKDLIKNIVTLMVDSKFDEIVSRNENGRLSAVDIENVLRDYPGNISQPPESAYDNFNVYEIYDLTKGARKVEFDLWYDNTRSDLTLSADICEDLNGNLTISIDDIHVL